MRGPRCKAGRERVATGCQEPNGVGGWGPLCYGSHLPSARFIAESPVDRALPVKCGLGLKLNPLSSEGEEEDEAAAAAAAEAGAEEAKRSCSKVTDSFRFLMPAVPTHGRCHFHSASGKKPLTRTRRLFRLHYTHNNPTIERIAALPACYQSEKD